MFARQPSAGRALLQVENLQKSFGGAGWRGAARSPTVRAVDGVSLDIGPGETLGVVGETGSGKSTLGRLILRLIEPTGGRIVFDGDDITALSPRKLRRFRNRLQMVFQDPYGSLDPRMSVEQLIREPMIVQGLPRSEIQGRADETMRRVGLDPALASRYPHEFSGGQRQRIGIARALVLDPKLLVLDEPVSALDVSIQAQILNLLREIQRRTGIAYLFIAHDLAVVRHVSHRVAVMYLGAIVETAPRDALYARPLHPYTVSLLSAVPVPNPAKEQNRRRVMLHGEISSATRVPSGCRFHPRCYRARLVAKQASVPTTTHLRVALPTACVEQPPRLEPANHGHDVAHEVACHFARFADEESGPAAAGAIEATLS